MNRKVQILKVLWEEGENKGLTVKEIADNLNIPIATVYKTLDRIRTQNMVVKREPNDKDPMERDNSGKLIIKDINSGYKKKWHITDYGTRCLRYFDVI